MWINRIVLLAALATAVILVVIYANRDSGQQKEFSALQQTLTPKGSFCSAISITHAHLNETVSWTCQNNMNWEEYAAWIAKNLQLKYRAVSKSSDEMVFFRSDTGDTYRMTIQCLGKELPMRVRLTIIGYPD